MTSKLKKASPIQEELTTSISQIRKLCNPCGKEKREMAHALPAIIPPPSLLPSRTTGQALSPDRVHAPPDTKTSTASAPVTAAQPLFHEHTAHPSGRTARRDLSGHRVFALLHSPPFFFRSPQLTTAISSRARFNSAHISFPPLMNCGSYGVTFLMQHKLGDLTDLPRSVRTAL